jgi:hypothetical protein
MTTYICYDTFQHVKTIIIKFIFKTSKICPDAFHNEKTIIINFIVEMTSLILVQITNYYLKKNVVKRLRNII